MIQRNQKNMESQSALESKIDRDQRTRAKCWWTEQRRQGRGGERLLEVDEAARRSQAAPGATRASHREGASEGERDAETRHGGTRGGQRKEEDGACRGRQPP